MPDKELSSLKGTLGKLMQADPSGQVDVELQTGLANIPDLPDIPGFEDFAPDPVSKGIAISRVISTFMAGMQDPRLAQAMIQQFDRQDALAKQEAYNQYQIALGQVQAEREEIKFGQQVKEGLVREKERALDLRLRAANAALRAMELEFAKKQAEGRATEQDLASINEAKKLVDSLSEEQFGREGKDIELASFEDAVKKGFISEMDSRRLMADTPENVAAKEAMLEKARQEAAGLAIPYKAIVGANEKEYLMSLFDPEARPILDAGMIAAPDPRSGGFTNPQDAVIWASAMQAIAARSTPKTLEKVVEPIVRILVQQGWSDIEAQELMADVIFGEAPAEEAIDWDWLVPKAPPKKDFKPIVKKPRAKRGSLGKTGKTKVNKQGFLVPE